MTTTAIRVGALLLLPVALLSSSCHSRQSAEAGGQPPAQAEVQPLAQPSEQPPVDAELERQREQIAQARSKCEAALQAIYAKKKNAEPVLHQALKVAADGSFDEAQRILESANPIIRQQNRWKNELSKWRKELRKLESSSYPTVREEATQASNNIAEQVKRFERGLPPGGTSVSTRNAARAARSGKEKK